MLQYASARVGEPSRAGKWMSGSTLPTAVLFLAPNNGLPAAFAELINRPSPSTIT
jgi:hypothetical protein